MKNLIKALSNFQNECPIIHKDTKGHNYTYADLPQIFSVINPLLKKHKLCFTQLLQDSGIKTILFHVESGESLESFTTIPLVKLGAMNDYQSYGAGVSYFRRYALSSCLGIVTDKDTDAAGIQVKKNETDKPDLDLSMNEFEEAVNRCETIESLTNYYNILDKKYSLKHWQKQTFTNKKTQLTK